MGWALMATAMTTATPVGAVAALLDLGLDTFRPVDDNPVERATLSAELSAASVLDALARRPGGRCASG